MSVKTYDFIIGYENKVREFESVILIKNELEQRGYSVFVFQEIDPRYDDVYEVLYHARVLLVSCAYDDRFVEGFIRRFMTFDKLVNWQWEQVFLKALEDNVDSLINIHGDICRQAVHLAWGDLNVKRHTMLNNLPASNVIKTGSVSMDYLHPKFSSFFKTREEVLKEYDINPKYNVAILIGVFSRAFWTQEQLDKEEAESGFSYHEISANNRKRFDIEMDWIARALREHEDLFFIYRPHPGDEYDRCPKDVQDKLDQMVAETGRFIINQDYTVRQWFKVANKVYTGFSTTMADAYFAGVGCRLLSPAGIPILDDVRLFEGAKQTTNYDDFNSSLYTAECDNPIRVDYIEGYFGSKDELHYRVIADTLVKVLSDDSYLIDTSALRKKISEQIHNELSGKSFLKRLKLKLWKYDWFYNTYWAIMKLPVNLSYFKKQQEYLARINAYRTSYIASPSEYAQTDLRIKSVLDHS